MSQQGSETMKKIRASCRPISRFRLINRSANSTFINFKFNSYRYIVKSLLMSKCFESNLAKSSRNQHPFSRFEGIWISTSLDTLITLIHISTYDKLKEALIENKILEEDNSLYKRL